MNLGSHPINSFAVELSSALDNAPTGFDVSNLKLLGFSVATVFLSPPILLDSLPTQF